MADINKFVCTGRIGTVPELRSTLAGISFCKFRMASQGVKSKDASEAETYWFDIVAWRNDAEFISRYLSKGRKIAVECIAKPNQWQDKNGNRHNSIEFHITNVVAIDKPPKQNSENLATADFEEISDDDEDLPF